MLSQPARSFMMPYQRVAAVELCISFKPTSADFPGRQNAFCASIVSLRGFHRNGSLPISKSGSHVSPAPILSGSMSASSRGFPKLSYRSIIPRHQNLQWPRKNDSGSPPAERLVLLWVGTVFCTLERLPISSAEKWKCLRRNDLRLPSDPEPKAPVDTKADVSPCEPANPRIHRPTSSIGCKKR